MERLGLGPLVCLEANPRLIYGRMTGWGRGGPLSDVAGHDLNYLALSGVLHALGAKESPPSPPLTLVGDYGGGSMFLVTGVLSALWERERSGQGQVVDVAMVDGIGVLSQKIWAMRGVGTWSEERQANILDGAAPFYATYACSDGRYVAVAAIERRFFAELLAGLGLSATDVGDQYDRLTWSSTRALIAGRVATRSRDEWAMTFEGTDACVTPVLTFSEALTHPHAIEREAYIELEGVAQPAPAPRFERSRVALPVGPSATGNTGLAIEDALRRWAS
jgi:alpha-methylacyl-CoA racemase